ncbi:MAG: hypothetical protein ACYTKD_05185 [Planctomycetota bacterium]
MPEAIGELRAKGGDWQSELLAIAFSHCESLADRLAAVTVLAEVRDRQAFEAALPDARRSGPGLPWVLGYNLLQLGQREDLPALVDAMKTTNPVKQSALCWAFQAITYTYMGSPDDGIAGIDYHALYSKWLAANEHLPNEKWLADAMERLLGELEASSPQARGRALGLLEYIEWTCRDARDALPGAMDSKVCWARALGCPYAWRLWWKEFRDLGLPLANEPWRDILYRPWPMMIRLPKAVSFDSEGLERAAKDCVKRTLDFANGAPTDRPMSNLYWIQT